VRREGLEPQKSSEAFSVLADLGVITHERILPFRGGGLSGKPGFLFPVRLSQRPTKRSIRKWFGWLDGRSGEGSKSLPL